MNVNIYSQRPVKAITGYKNNNSWYYSQQILRSLRAEKTQVCFIIRINNRTLSYPIVHAGTLALVNWEYPLHSLGTPITVFTNTFHYWTSPQGCEGVYRLCLNNILYSHLLLVLHVPQHLHDSYVFKYLFCDFIFIWMNERWGCAGIINRKETCERLHLLLQ